MRVHPKSPESNVLGAGVSPDDLEIAIGASGYPLQSRVVDAIIQSVERHSTHRVVQEEWSYLDQDEGHVRQLDALLSFELESLPESFDPGRPSDPAAYLRGALVFLVECKRSDLPFVCFVRPLDAGMLPIVAGLPHRDLTIHMEADDPGFITMSARDALATFDLPLARHDRTAIALARVYRKGKSLELSGEEAFRGLALPILKATSYYLNEVEPGPARLYFDVRTIVPIAVVEAPLLAVHMEDGNPCLETVPWIRVVRHQPGDQGDFGLRASLTAFDIVHADYIGDYAGVALDSARELVRRARSFAPQLLTGHARWSDSLENPAHVAVNGGETPPFEALAPHLSDGQFEDWINERWSLSHRGGAGD